MSRENADQLSDVDMIVAYGDESLLKAVQADELMSQIPAVKNGAMVLIDSTTALAGAATPSILSIPYELMNIWICCLLRRQRSNEKAAFYTDCPAQFFLPGTVCAGLDSLRSQQSVGFPVVIQSILGIGEKTFETSIVMARVPRTVFGILAGAALAVSGALMQAVTRNPHCEIPVFWA